MDECQSKAVGHERGPALVLAGPGSGKTRVIISRAERIAKKLSSPQRMLSVTFTKAAAQEMERRCAISPHPVFRTVHSLCNNIISDYEESHSINFTRIEGDNNRKRDILKELYKQVNLTDPEELVLDKLSGWISRCNAFSDIGAKFETRIRNFPDIYERYIEYKKNNGFVDFDDMIGLAYKMLLEDRRLLEKYQGAYDHIQVDEAQDLSELQFKIIKLIGYHQNIFVVGDDDQSIYGFRGASPEALTDFTDNTPGCVVYKMEQNYRSTPEIVSCASKLIKNNRKRFEKNIYTLNDSGSQVKIRYFASGSDQGAYAGEIACKAVERGACAGILYRNNISGISVAFILTSKGIPFYTEGNLEIDEDNYIIRRLLDRLRQEELSSSFLIPSPLKVLEKMKREGYYKECIAQWELSGKHKNSARAYLELIRLLCKMSVSYNHCRNLIKEHNRALERIKENGPGDERLFLSTVHSAKGLEYDTVCIIDNLKDEFPGGGSETGDLLEEERRLFYVAMTRAKKELYLMYPLKRGDKEEEESIFIKEFRKISKGSK